jgi:hypothetical protein
MKRNLLPIRLVFPQPQISNLSNPPKFFSGMCIFDDLFIIGYGDPNIPKSSTVPKILDGVKPKNGNEFELELALVLPDLLPNLDGKTEYSIELPDGVLWVSNQMAVVSYKEEGRDFTAIVPRHAAGSPNEKFNEILKKEPRKFIKTFVVWKGIIKGEDADSAMEDSIDDAVNRFINLLNEFVLRLLVLEHSSKEDFGITTPVYNQIYFDYVYFNIKGFSEFTGFNRIALNVIKARLSPANLKIFDSTKKWDDDIFKMLSIAKTYISGGSLEYGFLLLVISAELATSRFVYEKLKSIGVPQNKLDDMRKSLTFNVMFNSHVPVLTKDKEKLDKDIVDKINDARKRRNDFMHEAELDIDGEYLTGLKNAVINYVDYLERVRN